MRAVFETGRMLAEVKALVYDRIILREAILLTVAGVKIGIYDDCAFLIKLFLRCVYTSQ